MSTPAQYVIFRLEAQQYGLPLTAVARIVRAVEITPLPEAPALVAGLVNVAGRILPVFNLRRRLALADRPVDPLDQLLIAQTSRRSVVLWIDEAIGVTALSEAERIEPESPGRRPPLVTGALKLRDGLVLIQDLEQFLGTAEQAALERALEKEAAGAG